MARIPMHFCLILLAACLTLAPFRVSAGEACPPADWAKVVELSKKAKKFMDAGKFEAALANLEYALAICPEPRLHRSMGMVLEKAGRDAEALAEFRLCADDKMVDVAARIECQDHVGELEKDTAAAVMATEVVAPVPVQVPVIGALPPSPAEVEKQKSEPVVSQNVVPILTSKPKAVGNWVGIGLGVAATGLGTAFLIQYGLDKSNARVAYCGEGGCYAADVVGPRNLGLGISFSVAGVAAVILSAVLWPKSKIKAAVAPVNGGGILALTVDL